jgi:hypothetical protein
VEEQKLEDQILCASQKDAEVLEELNDLKFKGFCKMLDDTFKWEEEDSLIYFCGKLYIPPDTALRQNIVKSCHDVPTAKHPGQSQTLKLVSRHYWWLCVRSFVMEYVSGCNTCQCNKEGVHQNIGLMPNNVPEGL